MAKRKTRNLTSKSGAEIEPRQALLQILLTHLRVLLDRLERDRDYGFIDTKFSTLTGQDFASHDPIRGKNTLYSWIQGRGLEALAEHARWLRSEIGPKTPETEMLARRSAKAVKALGTKLASLLPTFGGHVPFMFRSDGTPLAINEYGHSQPSEAPAQRTYGDLFWAKGLLAAGLLLNKKRWLREGLDRLGVLLADIQNGRFRSDQQPLSPPFRSTAQSSARGHGPWTLALSGIELAYRATGALEWLELGWHFIQHVVTSHVNQGQFTGLQRLDLVETLDEQNRPLQQDGVVLCVPGHALEFVGLAGSILLQLRKQAKPALENRLAQLEEMRSLLPELFLHTFELGYVQEAGGIVSSFDLRKRAPAANTMPWWAIPETVRSASVVLTLVPQGPFTTRVREIRDQLIEDFLSRWVNPQAYFWAYQSRDLAGHPVDVVPATPDADPCYHTGLSFIESFRVETEQE